MAYKQKLTWMFCADCPTPTACVPTTPNQPHLLLLFLQHQFKRILVIVSNKPTWVSYVYRTITKRFMKGLTNTSGVGINFK